MSANKGSLISNINNEDVTLIPKRLVEENTLGVRLWTLPSYFCGLFVESGGIRAC